VASGVPARRRAVRRLIHGANSGGHHRSPCRDLVPALIPPPRENAAETERLTLELAAQAGTRGVNLDPEIGLDAATMVMQGQPRARRA
jgi:hypothetical protein